MTQPYRNVSTIVGPLQDGRHVRYRSVMNGRDKLKLNLFGIGLTLTSIMLITWIVMPAKGHSWSVASVAVVVMMLMIEFIRIIQTATLWVFANKAVDPVPLTPKKGLHVAVLTTIVPGKEPFELVFETLKAMKQLRYDGLVDVWLLDEGNDPDIKAACAAIGVHHFSRKGHPEWNTESGEFKARTKHGNHNSWRAVNEKYYDIVAQMDPDHVPGPDFLERSLGYFADPDVGFVVAPQVYGNLSESWIARAAAFQAYVFHGIIQRGGNGLQAPLLIGTNHLYRTEAFKDIGGYQDSIIEDHLTSMAMYAKRNQRGVYWKGVYTPDILAVGEGPTSFTDYFNQQKRWAYGIWQIMGTHSPKMFGGMRPAQRLSFAMLQFFYPSVAISFVLSFVLTGTYLSGNVQGKSVYEWLAAWGLSMATSLGFFFWLRRFNLVEHERKDWGLEGMSLLLMCLPVYVSAGLQAVRRKALRYAVTAKGDLTSPDSIRTFRPHLVWASVAALMLSVSIAGYGSSFIGTRLWLVMPLVFCTAPFVIHLISGRKTRPKHLARKGLVVVEPNAEFDLQGDLVLGELQPKTA